MKHPNITHYFVIAENWDKVVMTAACYRELKLQMSSGDYGSHFAIGLNFMDAMKLANKLNQERIYHCNDSGELVSEEIL